MVKKFFPLDKNYLLENVQHSLEEELLSQMLRLVTHQFEMKINPLGLEDSFTGKIRRYELKNFRPLHNFYDYLSAIYRYKFGANQLEFLWDGSDHSVHYKQGWTKHFLEWVIEFCREELFIQAVLDLTVFHPGDDSVQMIENRMNHFVLKHFGARIHKTKGLMVA